MIINLQIEQSESYEFFREFDKLGQIQQQIWRAAVWWVKRFPSAHPCQSTIAKKVSCSREHVNRTFSKFKRLGWLCLISRGRKRAKILGIPLSLVSLDLTNRQYFARIDITSGITHSYSNRKKETSYSTGASFHEVKVPSYLEGTKFSQTQRLKLALIGENYYRSAIESINYQLQKGIRICDPCSYVVGAAIRMAEKAGIKLDWPNYYRTLNKKAA